MNTFTDHTDKAWYLGNPESGSPEWHEQRSKVIGGSEIGTIAGLNQYESAYTLWHKKVGLIDGSITENWSIRFGKAFERPILEMFAEEHPELDVMETGTFGYKGKSWIGANPDAIAYNKDTEQFEIIEIKTARREWDEIPPSYIAQVQWYMHVLGFKTARIVAVAGWNWFEQVIEYDQFFAEALEAAADRFWTSVVEKTAPDWDGSTSTYETVRYMNSGVEEESVEIPNELALSLSEANNRSKQATQELNKIKSMVHSAIGNAKHATTSGTVVASKQTRNGSRPFLVIKG